MVACTPHYCCQSQNSHYISYLVLLQQHVLEQFRARTARVTVAGHMQVCRRACHTLRVCTVPLLSEPHTCYTSHMGTSHTNTSHKRVTHVQTSHVDVSLLCRAGRTGRMGRQGTVLSVIPEQRLAAFHRMTDKLFPGNAKVTKTHTCGARIYCLS